ncbi:MAG: hypothetical protein H6626_10900 [Pseudobdellovibrionaceae bacterium]|nr:MAG: hypothetical protein H6626_10900 [Pseudobdellovibrionaceae bacterium]
MALFKVVIKALILSVSVGCGAKNRPLQEWNVLTPGVPTRVSPDFKHSLLTSYILKQTHKPIFEYNSEKGYESQILDKWSRDLNYKHFQFCIYEPKTLAEDSYFDVNKLELFLNHFFKMEHLKPFIERNNKNCLKLTFSHSMRNIFTLLSQREHMPSFPGGQNWENGLGPFTIQSMTDEIVVLTKKGPTSSGIKRINFVNSNSRTVDSFIDRIDDFNLAPSGWVKRFDLSRFNRFNTQQLKISAIVLNIDDKEARRIIFDCFPIEEFRNAMNPETKAFVNIKSIFPLGIPGAQLGLIARKCSKTKIKQKPLRFVLWHGDHESRIVSIVKHLSEKTGIRIEVDFLPFNKLNELIYQNQSGYDLIPIKIDTKRKLHSPFFEAFIDPRKLITNQKVPGVLSTYEKLLALERSGQSSTSLAKILEHKLLDESLILPLYQVTKEIFYPKNITGLMIGDDFLDFPEISRIEKTND